MAEAGRLDAVLGGERVSTAQRFRECAAVHQLELSSSDGRALPPQKPVFGGREQSGQAEAGGTRERFQLANEPGLGREDIGRRPDSDTVAQLFSREPQARGVRSLPRGYQNAATVL